MSGRPIFTEPSRPVRRLRTRRRERRGPAAAAPGSRCRKARPLVGGHGAPASHPAPLPRRHRRRHRTERPGFYRNLPDTLRRIPRPGRPGSVHDSLVDATEELTVRTGGRPDLRLPFRTVTAPPAPTELLPDALRARPDGEPDRVLDAPTSEAWIGPWERHLRSLGVRFVRRAQVEELRYEHGRVTGVRLTDLGTGTARTATADHYVSAMPVEHARATWPPSLRAAAPPRLAGDYVATDIDLATMEGANESARRAVNAILDADGSSAARCRVWTLYRPPELALLQLQDQVRFRAGLPNLLDVG
jgi:hypothetical protein